MSRPSARFARLGLLASLLLPLAGTGCAALDALGLQKPTARLSGVRLQDISLTSITMLFDVDLSNPYAVDLPLVNVDYGLASGDKPFLSGKADLQGAVPAKGTRRLSLPTTVTFQQLLSVLSSVKLGSVVPYRAELGLSVNAPVLGMLRLPMQKEGQLPVPAPPEVKVQEIRWGKLSLDSAGGVVRLHMVNRNQFPVNMARLAYGLTLGKTEVAKAAIDKPLAFEANGGAGVVEIPISFSPRKLGLAVLGMLTGEGASYKLTGDVAVQTPFGPMSLPVEGVGKTVFRK